MATVIFQESLLESEGIKIDIPAQWLIGLDWQPTVLEAIIKIGIKQFKIHQALTLYQTGGYSIGHITEKFQISKQELIVAAKERGIEITVQEEVKEPPELAKQLFGILGTGNWQEYDNDLD
ncbi:hypothetical protein QUF64_08755 [Anaerolineales bacterium HSG6]|nr:hypothetical protein [Anaerolineales bacterium HSG6]MDM8529231.1 hypothetical protein [Anaerolineales bacterium HSG24]